MKRKISLFIAALTAVGMMQMAVPAPASACADPNCAWSPVTQYVGNVLYWTKYNCERSVGENFDPDPCQAL